MWLIVLLFDYQHGFFGRWNRKGRERFKKKLRKLLDEWNNTIIYPSFKSPSNSKGKVSSLKDKDIMNI